MDACRPATLTDLDDVVALAGALRAELAPSKGGELLVAREARAEPLADTYRSLIEQAEQSDDTCFVVGTFDDAVVGFGIVVVESLRDGRTLGVVTDLYVDPQARGVGVGEGIAAALLAFCTARDCIGVDAWALPGTRETKNFFEEQGFTARALVLHKRLAPPDA